MPNHVDAVLLHAMDGSELSRHRKSGVLVRPRSGKMALRTLAGAGFCKAGNLEKRLSDEIGGLSD